MMDILEQSAKQNTSIANFPWSKRMIVFFVYKYYLRLRVWEYSTVYFLAHYCPVAFFRKTFLNRWMIWEVVGLEISGDKWGLQKFWPET
jgi:hypothetical protein